MTLELELAKIESWREISRRKVLDDPERAKNCKPKDFLGRVLEIGDYVAYSIKFPSSGMELGYITKYNPPTINPEGNPDGGYVIVNRVNKRKFGKHEIREQFPLQGKNLVKLSKEEMTLYLLERNSR